MEERPDPAPAAGELLVQVEACAVCRTDLHVVDGELPQARLPVVPGHEIVGRVLRIGAGVSAWRLGQRVGIPWLGHTCGHCRYCLAQRENLCDEPVFTGYGRDGGFASHVTADAAYCFPLDLAQDAVHAAPLLCAGLIGWRALRAAGSEAMRIGIYGFGAAAHLVAQVAIHEKREIHAFSRAGDVAAQAFARSLGVAWAGGSDQPPPDPLDAAIIFAPVGGLVPTSLKAVRKGGPVVCAGIHMSDIPSFPYSILWEERQLVSVANLTRQDGDEFFRIAPEVRIKTEVTTYPLDRANEALSNLRDGRLVGAAVLVP
jgi:propanol-preferring alcohol dehydrogenase